MKNWPEMTAHRHHQEPWKWSNPNQLIAVNFKELLKGATTNVWNFIKMLLVSKHCTIKLQRQYVFGYFGRLFPLILVISDIHDPSSQMSYSPADLCSPLSLSQTKITPTPHSLLVGYSTHSFLLSSSKYNKHCVWSENCVFLLRVNCQALAHFHCSLVRSRNYKPLFSPEIILYLHWSQCDRMVTSYFRQSFHKVSANY